jgi:hypothetical protein
VERYVTLLLRIVAKLFEIVTNDGQVEAEKVKLLQFVKNRIFVYTITRILPSVAG